jgi:hypothetical protein
MAGAIDQLPLPFFDKVSFRSKTSCEDEDLGDRIQSGYRQN